MAGRAGWSRRASPLATRCVAPICCRSPAPELRSPRGHTGCSRRSKSTSPAAWRKRRRAAGARRCNCRLIPAALNTSTSLDFDNSGAARAAIAPIEASWGRAAGAQLWLRRHAGRARRRGSRHVRCADQRVPGRRTAKTIPSVLRGNGARTPSAGTVTRGNDVSTFQQLALSEFSRSTTASCRPGRRGRCRRRSAAVVVRRRGRAQPVRHRMRLADRPHSAAGPQRCLRHRLAATG